MMIKSETTTIEQKATVKIVCGTKQGTGIVVAIRSGYALVLTAKHVLEVERTDRSLNALIKIDNISKLPNEKVTYQVSENDRVFLSEEHDLAAIYITEGVALFDEETINHLSFIDNDYGLSHCRLRGYPTMSFGAAALLNCEFDEFKLQSEFFSFHTKQVLDSFSADANSNVIGFSGGGIFFSYENRTYLLGLVTDYSAVNVFIGIRLSQINKFLEANELPGLPITTLIVDEKTKNALSRLKVNGDAVQAKVKTTIGNLHIVRSGLSEAVDTFKKSQLVLLYGEAGVGKSAFAKQMIETAMQDYPAELFVFSGEQFSLATLDLVLKELSIDLSFEEIISNSAFQANKIVWIESVEKLLETDNVEAFEQLLVVVKKTPSLKIVATIRKYGVQEFNFKFAWKLPELKSLIEVHPLSKEDLEVVTAHFPAISNLLKNEKIKHLLKIPFYLKYAVDILPALNQEEHLDEQSFKRIIWDEVIDRRSKERGSAFETLAVKRAKEMTLYTTAAIAPEIVSSLHSDNLITIEEDELNERYAPAHDVLEDWALIRFVKRSKKLKINPADFFQEIGHEPAMRRAFRLWLGEALQTPDNLLNDFIQKAVGDTSLERYWKDEIYIAVLLSDFSEQFFLQNEHELLKDDCKITLKLIHLLQTACKEPATEFSNQKPILMGSGWAAIIRFAYKNRDKFIKSFPLLLSFLLDWRAEVDASPLHLPDESLEAGLLLIEILETLKATYHGNMNRRLLDGDIETGILLAIRLTKVMSSRMEELIRRADGEINRKTDSKEYKTLDYYHTLDFYRKVIEYSLDGIFCWPLALHTPDLLIEIIKSNTILKPKKPASPFDFDERDDVESHFGLEHDHRMKFYPPSSYQTPTYYLLRYHVPKALHFIVETINASTKAYLDHCKTKGYYLVEVELELNDGSKVKQWGDSNLWAMYRGFGRAPHFLESVLMALEKYLFELGESSEEGHKELLRAIFSNLYRQSDSIATTAVLASVAMRFPQAVEDAVLPMFSTKYTLQWDEQRYMRELGPTSSWFTERDIHDIERRESDALPHRKLFKGLRHHLLNLTTQVGTYNDRIFAFLDRFHAEAEGDTDILWLKALSEMDFRKWQSFTDDNEPNKVFFSAVYEGAVKEFMDEGLADREQANTEAKHSLWIDKAYKTPEVSETRYAEWQVVYEHYSKRVISEKLYAKPGTLAAVALRDLKSKLSTEENQWSINAIYDTLDAFVQDREEHENSRQLNFDYQLMDVKPCLECLPSLFSIIKEEGPLKELKRRVLLLLLSAIHEHEMNELLTAIRFQLWKLDFDFAKRTVYFLVKYAQLKQDNDNWTDDYGHRDEEAKAARIEGLLQQTIETPLSRIDLTDVGLNYSTTWYLNRAFVIVPSDIEDEDLIGFCIDYVRLHLEYLKTERNRSPNYYTERTNISRLFPGMMLHMSQLRAAEVADIFFDNYDQDTSKVLRFGRESEAQEFLSKIMEYTIRSLDSSVSTEDETKFTTNFWQLWSHIHERNKERNSYHFASLILCEIEWKPEAKHWRPLEGKAVFLTELINYYGQVDLSAAIALFATIGDETLMPQGISQIASFLKNSSFLRIYLEGPMAEKLIQRCFENHVVSIKGNTQLLADLIFILDLMVENGSNRAFLIREKFIVFKQV